MHVFHVYYRADVLNIYPFLLPFQFCEKLGWKPKRGRFDILPLVLSAEDHCPKFFEIPENIIKRVKIEHPE